MNTFELMPTEDNLLQTLEKNLLKRNESLVYFYNLLLSLEATTSIAIDGKWGSGKTFFVKQSMLVINAKNPMSIMDDNKRTAIINALPFPKMEEGIPENYEVAIYYDAWENDNDTDPLLSLIYEIVKQLSIDYYFDEYSSVFPLAGSILEAFTGKNVTDIIQNLKCENPLKKIKEEKDLHDEINNFFSKLLEERGNHLVIFVDELDRCKPSYAVQLLERIKHYLYDERVTFVFSTNLEELQHTIKCFYGDTFDACRYLDRFFDLRISLPPADKNEFYREIGLESSYALENVCQKVIEVYNMELREITRFYRQVRTAVYEPTHDSKKWDFSFMEGSAKQLMLIYIVPILVGLKIVNISLYHEFICGRNSKPLMDMYKNSDLGEWLVARLLAKNDPYKKVEKDCVAVESTLQSLYEAIFVKDYTTKIYHTVLGDCEFNQKSMAYLRNVESMLSPYADYQI